MKKKIVKIVNVDIITDWSSHILFVYGSRGSGKTTTLAHKIIYHCIHFPKSKALLLRLTMPSFNKSVKLILQEALDNLEVDYTEHKGDKYFEFRNGSRLYYGSYFVSGKLNEQLKSSTWDYIWIEEATEFTLEALDEIYLTLRGTKGSGQLVLSFNPPHSSKHHIYKFYDKYKDINVKRVHFSYKDNPFLPDTYIRRLESYKNKDKGLYRRYTLGEWGVNTTEGLVYTHWELIDKDKINIKDYDIVGGVDFGWNHPNAFTLNAFNKDTIIVVDGFKKQHLTTEDFAYLIKKTIENNNLDLGDIILYADSAEPDRIKILSDSGLIVTPVKKHSILSGIDKIKERNFMINRELKDYIDELNNYRWAKDNKTGEPLDTVIKENDDLLDATRYALEGYLENTGEYLWA